MTVHAAGEAARITGDKQERFMTCLTPCLARLSRYCHAIAKDGNDRSSREHGRDLLSDAILAAYEHFDELRSPEAFTSYIFTTARRIYWRSQRRKKFWAAFGTETNEIADERTPSPETVLDLDVLDAALKKLPDKQREAVILFEISELSLKEIRDIQGGSLSGVKSRIVRGRERLAELLGERAQQQSASIASTPLSARPRETSFERTQVAYLMKENL